MVPLYFLCCFWFVTEARHNPLPRGYLIIRDIDIVTWNRTNLSRTQSSALRNLDRKWVNGKVPYYIHHSITSDGQRQITAAMEEIHQKTCVRFRPGLDSDQHYVLFHKPPENSCSSSVGRAGGGQEITLGSSCYSRSTVLHELMHALGFIHEHNRSDRDQYVTINWNNIREHHTGDFKKYDDSDLTLMESPYSYDSIMHYKEDLASKVTSFYHHRLKSIYDGSPTIIPKKSGVKLGGGEALSPIDVQRINKFYGCLATVPPTTPKPKPPTERPKTEKELSAEVAGRRVLKSTYGTYLRASLFEYRVDLVSQEKDWEHWHIEDLGGKVLFKANDILGRIMRGESNGQVYLGFRHPVAFLSMGKWTPFKNSDGSWSFRSAHGKWLSARPNGSITSVDQRGTSEHFWLTSW